MYKPENKLKINSKIDKDEPGQLRAGHDHRQPSIIQIDNTKASKVHCSEGEVDFHQ